MVGDRSCSDAAVGCECEQDIGVERAVRGAAVHMQVVDHVGAIIRVPGSTPSGDRMCENARFDPCHGALLTYTYSMEERFRAQAVNEFLVFGTAATASLRAGTVMHYFGWLRLILIPVPILAFVCLACWS